MNPVLIDLVSEDEMQVNTVPVVAEVPVEHVVSTVVIDVVDTSDRESVVTQEQTLNGETVYNSEVSNSDMDSDFFGIKTEDKKKWKRTVEEPRMTSALKYGKTSANDYVRKQRKSKGLLQRIFHELDDSSEEAWSEEYDGDVDVGDLDLQDYDIGPVIQTA